MVQNGNPYLVEPKYLPNFSFMNKIITIKTSDYKYPTYEEKKFANENYPELRNFGFEDVTPRELFFKETLKAYYKKSHLFEWDNCLLNRLGKLSETFDFLFSNYSRGISDISNSTTNQEFANSFLFDYYTEVFYYFFFSTRDTVLQILNVFYDLDLKENEVFWDKVFNELRDNKVHEYLKKFQESIKSTSEYRNSFTHRFPPNHPDYRPKLAKSVETTTLSLGLGNHFKPEEFIVNIKESLNNLSILLNELRNEINSISYSDTD